MKKLMIAAAVAAMTAGAFAGNCSEDPVVDCQDVFTVKFTGKTASENADLTYKTVQKISFKGTLLIDADYVTEALSGKVGKQKYEITPGRTSGSPVLFSMPGVEVNEATPINLESYAAPVVHMMGRMGYDFFDQKGLNSGKGILHPIDTSIRSSLACLGFPSWKPAEPHNRETRHIFTEGDSDNDDSMEVEVHAITLPEEEVVEQPAPPKLEDSTDTTLDELSKINLGTNMCPKPTFISKSMANSEVQAYVELLRDYMDVFDWGYEDMPGLDPKVAVHKLVVSRSLCPIKQGQRRMRPELQE